MSIWMVKSDAVSSTYFTFYYHRHFSYFFFILYSDPLLLYFRDRATKVKYTVSLLNTDSSNTALQEPNQGVIKGFLPNDVSVCDCIARKVRSIGVTGQISNIDKVKVQNVLRLVWMTANSGNYIIFNFRIVIYI